MKENILKILKEIQLRPHFENAGYKLTLNYKNVIQAYPDKRFDENTQQLFIDTIDEMGEITSFNFTTKIESGINHYDEYAENWKSVDYVFYGYTKKSAEDFEDEKLISPDRNCWFAFNSLGERGEFRMSQKLSRHEDDGSRYGKEIKGNAVAFNNVGELLDRLIEFDFILDKHHDEQKYLIEKFRNEQSTQNIRDQKIEEVIQ